MSVSESRMRTLLQIYSREENSSEGQSYQRLLRSRRMLRTRIESSEELPNRRWNICVVPKVQTI